MARGVGGEIEWYGLEDWWLVTFTPHERDYIASIYRPLGSDPARRILVDGHITLETDGRDACSFLHTLATWIPKREGATIRDRIICQALQIAKMSPIAGPGYVGGRFMGTYVEEVKEMKREGHLGEALALLVRLEQAANEQAAFDGMEPAHWYADQRGIVERRITRERKKVHK